MSHPVIKSLQEEPWSFGFYQAIYLLQRDTPEEQKIGKHNNPSSETVRLRNEASLCFPVSQITELHDLSTPERERWELQTTLFGLYGSCSPLPLEYMSSLVSLDEENEEPIQRIRGFLDIFNHRLLSLGYRIERKRLLYESSQRTRRSHFTDACFAISGYDMFQKSEETSALTFNQLRSIQIAKIAGLMSSSASSLVRWLKALFRDFEFSVTECVQRWVQLNDSACSSLGVARSSLGSASSGGGAVLLGNRLVDKESKFCVAVGPMKWDGFISFLPGQTTHQSLVNAINFFSRKWLMFDIELILVGSDCQYLRACLDGKSSRIGLTTGLFSDHNGSNNIHVTLDISSSQQEVSGSTSEEELGNGKY